MIIFDDVERLKFELLALGQPLPDRLSIRTIAELWTDNKKWQQYHVDDMLTAFNANALKGEKLKPPSKNPFSEADFLDIWDFYNHDILILREDYLVWLESQNQPMPTGCLLEKWWNDSKTENVSDLETNGSGEIKHRQLLAYLKPIFEKEGQPTGTDFLKKLKNYENRTREPGKGPIIQVVSYGDASGRGFQYNLGKGIDFYTLTNLGKRCSEWRNKENETTKKPVKQKKTAN